MTASVQRITANTDIDEAVSIMNRDGAVIISGLLSRETYRDLRNELDPDFEKADFCKGLFYGELTKRTHSLAAKSKTCRTMIMLPQIVGIMNQILGPFCDKIQLNLTQGIQIWPGERPQVVHRDDALFPFEHKPFEFMINAMWAYSEFTKENGATIVIPGSHNWEDKARLPKVEEATQAEMAPGEVLVYVGSLLHCGGANYSKLPRTGVVMSYCLGWLRQSENQYFAAPPEIGKYFDKELQDMLGYCVQRPNLGMYEGTEPNILFGDKPEKAVTEDRLTPEQNELIRRYYAGEFADKTRID
ncbi:phytanoyl-CoA dioxygenase family protein [Methylocapsa sp. D3K7]|uniref:phytanoyl-CoA dioxygenase family protein n=1 Tax=Methylocapsa sp. D3K7 TaxID=3041435 RepID=UPI00244ECA79|nr:phytanoyl-CoA dioxygenase family protein [Methylocapsa sp. D3K7]WGJ15120.1 phytanoyl-CoA dioxygenase family protein [Methylocapsa sp. D3K7]